MQRAGQGPEGHLLAEHGAPAAGVRQRANQDVGRLAPGRVGQLEPVPLDLLPGRVIDLCRRRPAATLLADQAHRPQLQTPQLPDQRRIGPVEPGRGELVKQRHRRQVRIVDEPRLDVAAKRLHATRRPLAPHPGRTGEVLRDRLAVTARVPADRRHRPAARLQCVDLHVVLLCEHPPRDLLLDIDGLEHRRPWRGSQTDRARARESTPARRYAASPASTPARASTRSRPGEFL